MGIPNVDMGSGITALRKFSMQSAGRTDDFSLIRDVQRGNHAAFERLVYAHDQGVLRLALRITGSQADAQDIYQETLLKAFKKLTGFRFEPTFSTWIYRIATNVCLEHLRRKRTRKETSAIEVSTDGGEYDLLNQAQGDRPPSNPEQQVLGRELGTHISRALMNLTPRERIIFELKHYQGLTLWTMSGILNCSEATIKTTPVPGHAKASSASRGFLPREELFGEARGDAGGLNQVHKGTETPETSERRKNIWQRRVWLYH